MDETSSTTNRTIAIVGVVIVALLALGGIWRSRSNDTETTQAKPSIAGTWTSESVEQRPGQNDTTQYLRREFNNTETEATTKVMFYADPEGITPTLTINLTGPYEILDKSSSVPDAYEANFTFDEAKLTPHNEFFVNLLSSAPAGTCGTEPWQIGVEQDVTATSGCSTLGLDLANNNREYDIVKVENNKLYYGTRPTDGSGPDKPEKRPTSLQTPVVKQ